MVGDTESKPEKGVVAMKKLVLKDKVDVLVGEYSSGVALAIQPFLSGYKIVLPTTARPLPTYEERRKGLCEKQILVSGHGQFRRNRN